MSELEGLRKRMPQTMTRTAYPDWTDLHVHSHPSPPALCLGESHRCSHCGSQLLSREREFFCHCGGKFAISPLPALPEGWEERFWRPAFRAHSWQYNNLPVHLYCTFTAMGVSGDQGFVHQPAPSCVKIHGHTYHRVLLQKCRDLSIGTSMTLS